MLYPLTLTNVPGTRSLELKYTLHNAQVSQNAQFKGHVLLYLPGAPSKADRLMHDCWSSARRKATFQGTLASVSPKMLYKNVDSDSTSTLLN